MGPYWLICIDWHSVTFCRDIYWRNMSDWLPLATTMKINQLLFEYPLWCKGNNKPHNLLEWKDSNQCTNRMSLCSPSTAASWGGRAVAASNNVTHWQAGMISCSAFLTKQTLAGNNLFGVRLWHRVLNMEMCGVEQYWLFTIRTLDQKIESLSQTACSMVTTIVPAAIYSRCWVSHCRYRDLGGCLSHIQLLTENAWGYATTSTPYPLFMV